MRINKTVCAMVALFMSLKSFGESSGVANGRYHVNDEGPVSQRPSSKVQSEARLDSEAGLGVVDQAPASPVCEEKDQALKSRLESMEETHGPILSSSKVLIDGHKLPKGDISWMKLYKFVFQIAKDNKAVVRMKKNLSNWDRAGMGYSEVANIDFSKFKKTVMPKYQQQWDGIKMKSKLSDKKFLSFKQGLPLLQNEEKEIPLSWLVDNLLENMNPCPEPVLIRRTASLRDSVGG